MSRQQRLVFAGIAAVIAVVAVIVLAGGSDDEPETAATTPTPAATATASPDATAEATPTTEPTAEPTPEAVEIEVEGGKVEGGPVDVEVEQGERARFTVRSDTADHVHVHGYDVLKDVAAGGKARFEFKAKFDGEYEVELEDRAVQIIKLVVQP